MTKSWPLIILSLSLFSCSDCEEAGIFLVILPDQGSAADLTVVKSGVGELPVSTSDSCQDVGDDLQPSTCTIVPSCEDDVLDQMICKFAFDSADDVILVNISRQDDEALDVQLEPTGEFKKSSCDEAFSYKYVDY